MKRIGFFIASVLCALTLIMPCVAEEATTDVVDEVTEEVTEEVTQEPTETPKETPTEEVKDAEPDTNEDVADPVEEDGDEWDKFKAKITDSATWTMIGAAIITVLTTVGTVKSKFDGIASLVRNKADNDTLKGAISDMEKELRNSFNENHKEVSAVMKRYEDALKNTEANEQRLYAILTLFMTNCKISESAKTEILNILSDVKKYDGDIKEFVEQAQEAINKDIAEKEAKAPATPTLNQMLEEDYMDLG